MYPSRTRGVLSVRETGERFLVEVAAREHKSFRPYLGKPALATPKAGKVRAVLFGLRLRGWRCSASAATMLIIGPLRATASSHHDRRIDAARCTDLGNG